MTPKRAADFFHTRSFDSLPDTEPSARARARLVRELERIAREQLVLVTTSASDWLDSSGTAERVDGDYRVSARKSFASGSPVGSVTPRS